METVSEANKQVSLGIIRLTITDTVLSDIQAGVYFLGTFYNSIMTLMFLLWYMGVETELT